MAQSLHFPSIMENTLTVYVASLNEQWEMPDSLALKLNDFEASHPVGAHNADEVHTAWFNTLSEGEKACISQYKAEE